MFDISYKTFNSPEYEGVAELSEIEDASIYGIKTLPQERWYFFNRLKVRDSFMGKGFGRQLMERVIAWADSEGISIINPISTYGQKGGLERKIKFFKKFGFELIEENLVIRRIKK